MIAAIMSKPEDRNLFRTLYVASHNNAVDLLSEAELLFEKGRYARSYSLAFTALEEIAKSQLAADVYTGLIDEDEFQKVFWKHEKKIARMEWASIDAERYLSADGYFVDVEKPSFTARMLAILYPAYQHRERASWVTPKDD